MPPSRQDKRKISKATGQAEKRARLEKEGPSKGGYVNLGPDVRTEEPEEKPSEASAAKGMAMNSNSRGAFLMQKWAGRSRSVGVPSHGCRGRPNCAGAQASPGNTSEDPPPHALPTRAAGGRTRSRQLRGRGNERLGTFAPPPCAPLRRPCTNTAPASLGIKRALSAFPKTLNKAKKSKASVACVAAARGPFM